jgi:hypothetical protein
MTLVKGNIRRVAACTPSTRYTPLYRPACAFELFKPCSGLGGKNELGDAVLLSGYLLVLLGS